MDEIRARAMAAWFREGRRAGVTLDQPDGGGELVTEDGKDYVVLSNGNGVLAVYRIRNDGKLKRLRRWPAAVVVKGI